MREYQLPIWFLFLVCVEAAAQQAPNGISTQRYDIQQYKQISAQRVPRETEQAPNLPDAPVKPNLIVAGAQTIGPLLAAQTGVIKSLSDRIEKLNTRVDKLEAAAKR